MGFYAIALDGKQGALPRAHEQSGSRAVRRASSLPSAARIVASKLLDSDFFSGWGVRTVARGEARYNPMSYHNGSIWPHDNALLAQGLARVRRQERVSATSSRALMRATSYLDHRRIPELYCGFRRRPSRGTHALSGRLLAAGLGGGGARSR